MTFFLGFFWRVEPKGEKKGEANKRKRGEWERKHKEGGDGEAAGVAGIIRELWWIFYGGGWRRCFRQIIGKRRFVIGYKIFFRNKREEEIAGETKVKERRKEGAKKKKKKRKTKEKKRMKDCVGGVGEERRYRSRRNSHGED